MQLNTIFSHYDFFLLSLSLSLSPITSFFFSQFHFLSLRKIRLSMCDCTHTETHKMVRETEASYKYIMIMHSGRGEGKSLGALIYLTAPESRPHTLSSSSVLQCIFMCQGLLLKKCFTNFSKILLSLSSISCATCRHLRGRA